MACSMRSNNVIFYLILPVIVLVSLCCSSSVLAAISPPLKLTVSENQPRHISVGEYDFGQFSPLEISIATELTIRHVFTLRNLNKQPITLEHFQSYLQIRATLVNKILPCVINPGQKVSVEVELATPRLQAGNIQESIDVYLQGQTEPAATLKMVGIYVPAVSFSPSVADFGTVSAGMGKIIIVQVILDPQLMPPDSPPIIKDSPHLSSSNPDIHVTALGVIPSPAPPNASLMPTQQGTSKLDQTGNTLTYRLTLSPQAKTGVIRGQLLLLPIAYTAASVMLQNVSIPITGKVTRNGSLLNNIH